MNKTRIAINGFGRIGRAAARIITAREDLQLVAINDLLDITLSEHLFEFDSTYGKFDGSASINTDANTMTLNGDTVQYFSERSIDDLPWAKLNVDVVLECTGIFRTAETAGKHITSGAKKVVLSAPCKSNGFETIVLGVNDENINESAQLYSNASCTTNCLAPLCKALNDALNIEKGTMTTIHSYTNNQRGLDAAHKDPRRARAAGLNIIPTTTGAAKALGTVLPELDGKMSGISVRVPTPTVSLVDLVCTVGKSTTVEEVTEILQAYSNKNPDVMGMEARPLVSSDYKMDSRSCVIDMPNIIVQKDLVKVLAWYDNEWGYASRLVELAAKVA